MTNQPIPSPGDVIHYGLEPLPITVETVEMPDPACGEGGIVFVTGHTDDADVFFMMPVPEQRTRMALGADDEQTECQLISGEWVR